MAAVFIYFYSCFHFDLTFNLFYEKCTFFSDLSHIDNTTIALVMYNQVNFELSLTLNLSIQSVRFPVFLGSKAYDDFGGNWYTKIL